MNASSIVKRQSKTEPSALKSKPRRVSALSETAGSQEQGQGRALLEEWPRRISADVGEEMDISLCSSSNKKVSFSPYSRLHVYQVDEEVERNKSYGSSERKVFQAQALHDAFRIQALIKSCPYEGGLAIRYLMEKNLLSSEELLGIENLIMGAEKVIKERRQHTIVVLEAQKDLLEKKDVNIDQALAYVATRRSSKTFQKARLRAALAA
ncbi:hypothetical protein HJC23_010184 [Cyclotella cryptica]|uniref:Uncharacterized protein n=1 Tax=Cyclotella cryptica TaxID=29204 RepID=A0ABD3PHK4_9STRA